MHTPAGFPIVQIPTRPFLLSSSPSRLYHVLCDHLPYDHSHLAVHQGFGFYDVDVHTPFWLAILRFPILSRRMTPVLHADSRRGFSPVRWWLPRVLENRRSQIRPTLLWVRAPDSVLWRCRGSGFHDFQGRKTFTSWSPECRNSDAAKPCTTRPSGWTTVIHSWTCYGHALALAQLCWSRFLAHHWFDSLDTSWTLKSVRSLAWPGP